MRQTTNTRLQRRYSKDSYGVIIYTITWAMVEGWEGVQPIVGTEYTRIFHGVDLRSSNVVAIISGTLHARASCKWCDELVERAESRRIR